VPERKEREKLGRKAALKPDHTDEQRRDVER
jgi:hypothetical protein